MARPMTAFPRSPSRLPAPTGMDRASLALETKRSVWPWVRSGHEASFDQNGSLRDLYPGLLFDRRAGVGETFRIGSVPFTVIGVLDKKGLGAAGRSQDDVVFIPLSTAKSRVLGAVRGTTREALDFISIKVSDPTAMSEMEREIEALLRQRHRIRGDAPSDFRIENPADVLIARGAAVRILGILLIAVAAVSLVVGGISIMNIMLVSVTERTREIGLRMAVGASRRDIRWQFLIEDLILSLM